MAKKKLKRFAEMRTFANVFQPSTKEILSSEYKLKGKWHSHYFKNQQPLILELGCGKGEYTIELAKRYPHHNFIGVDIKGARMWRGAKTALELKLNNVAFVRTRIELIHKIFGLNEVDGIWFTFSDPQRQKPRKRLTSSRFLENYAPFLHPDAVLHLKTDSHILYHYTKDLIEINQLPLLEDNDDIYSKGDPENSLAIKTFYEKQFLAEGKKIKYLKFQLIPGKKIIEPPNDWKLTKEMQNE